MASNSDINDIWTILRAQKHPREAAALLAVVRAKLHINAGEETEAKVRAMIRDDNDGCLKAWSELTGSALSS